jgi:hypothetical protein
MKLISAISALAVVGLLAGCRDSGPSTNGQAPAPGAVTSSAPSPAAAGKPSCDLAPASLVNATLGTHVGEAEVQNLSTVVVCRYRPATGSGSVVVRMQTGMSAATFATSRGISDSNGLTTADLPGFQDNAYTSVLKAGSIVTNTIVAIKGTTEILVSSPASFDAEKDLETQLFAKLA